ncbi:phosphopantetheine-binding protein [Phytoactinopolyspora halotolerans]|uniref:Carrier domain-containing protein n=1 Tax=Phytoactinopolyspora halotolerans TaxID=1981512 RepID=A0A6L9S409_9ACTN|nr:phosphopantetheine-binding protein [Phytoactinopolyspora halotolerans]NED99845.1 hypothetical protein [Phytoactinopolyspora halotolerans]
MAHADGDREALQEIWCDLLGIEEVHAGDDFFVAGGASLTALTLVSRIWDRIGVQIDLEDVYENATFDALCRRVAAGRS